MDFSENWRSYYFYSGKSVPSSFFGSLYVWCRDQLLYSYQKFIIILFTVLILSFPAYAEDERYEFQNIQNEALFLQGYDLNNYYSSITKESNDLSTTIYRIGDNLFHFNTFYSGTIVNNDNFYSFYITERNQNNAQIRIPFTSNVFSNVYSGDILINPDSYSVFGFYRYDNGDRITFLNGSTFTNEELNLLSIIGGKMTAYLEQVATVFTWILTHITELITFILGNPFLAVSLVLFMCGAVISFYVRIKNS